MALHTRKDFIDLCGISSRELSVYIKRGKVVLTGEYINDTNPSNAAFLQKFSERKNQVVSINAPQVEVYSEKDEPLPEESFTERSTSSAPAKQMSQYAIERAMKLSDLEKKKVDIRIAKLKEDKLMGDLIPTELVRTLIMTQSESTKFAFSEGCENLIVLISQKKQLSATEVADIRSKLSALINKCIDNSVSFSVKKLKTIVTEYSQKRDVGDHD